MATRAEKRTVNAARLVQGIALVTFPAARAMRVLIVWIYRNTGGSLLLAQLMHISMSGSLVMLDPVHVSPAQEALWYGMYAVALWALVALVVWRYGKHLMRERERDVVDATLRRPVYA